MNLNVSGVMNKVKKNADWLAFLLSAYQRFDGDIGQVVKHYTSAKPLNVLQHVLSNPGMTLKHRLWESEHGYTGLFKISLIAYLATEFGLLPNKYKGLAKKIMWGSGVAAVTLPGSYGGEKETSGGGHSSGGDPMKGDYNI